MIDWTKLTDDPVFNPVRDKIIKYLLSIRKPLKKDYESYLAGEIRGKTVLDIGVCEHTLDRMLSPAWKHNVVRENASFSLGVDIIPELIEKLKIEGMNVELCDAISDKYLGRKFDIVHVGDVIEHVGNLISLLEFCARHLEVGGKIIVRTPNPYNFNYVYLQKKFQTDRSNLEHVCYVCPTHALELGRRVGLNLSGYCVLYPYGFSHEGLKRVTYFISKGKFRHAFAELFSVPETYSTIYVYEFGFK